MKKQNPVGKSLYALRKNRGLSAREISSGVDPSSITRFENGHSDFGVNRLIPVLNESGTDAWEFFQSIHGQPGSLDSLLNRIAVCVHDNDGPSLDRLAQQELQEYYVGRSRIHRLTSIMVHSVLISMSHSNDILSADDSSIIAHYLLSVKKWYKYEFVLYKNTVPHLDTRLHYELFAKLLENSPAWEEQSVFQLYFVEAIQSLTLRLVTNKKYVQAKHLLNKIDLSRFPDYDMFIRYKILLFRSVVNYLASPSENLKRNIQKVLSLTNVYLDSSVSNKDLAWVQSLGIQLGINPVKKA